MGQEEALSRIGHRRLGICRKQRSHWPAMSRSQGKALVEEAIRRRGKVQFERLTSAGKTYWNGIPLQLNDELLLVATLDQFRFDGFSAFRWEEVAAIRSGDNERFFERVLRSEGLLERFPQPGPIRLDQWASLLDDVRARSRYAIIECEKLASPTFHIGELAGVKPDAAFVRYVQANGVRDSEPTRIPLSDITMVRWGEHYLEMYGKYCVCETHH